MDRDIEKRKMAILRTLSFASNIPQLVNMGSQITKFCCLISNHPSSTLRLLYDNAIVVGPRDCCEQNFNLLTVPNRTYSTGQSHVGLCPIFL